MICKKCKAELPDNSLYCCYCGKKQATVRKSRTHANYAVTADVYIHKDISTLRDAMTSLRKAE